MNAENNNKTIEKIPFSRDLRDQTDYLKGLNIAHYGGDCGSTFECPTCKTTQQISLWTQEGAICCANQYKCSNFGYPIVEGECPADESKNILGTIPGFLFNHKKLSKLEITCPGNDHEVLMMSTDYVYCAICNLVKTYCGGCYKTFDLCRDYKPYHKMSFMSIYCEPCQKKRDAFEEYRKARKPEKLKPIKTIVKSD